MRRARLARHLTFTSLCIASWGALFFLVPADRLHDAASITTAYASLAFLTVALTIGPLNVLRHYPNPTNLYLRQTHSTQLHLGWSGRELGRMGLARLQFWLQEADFDH